MTDAPDIVYIVTSGEYSDYGIDSVWTTREAAEEAASTDRDARVEEWAVDTTETRTFLEWRARVTPGADVRVDDRPMQTNYHSRPEAYRASNGWYGWGYGPTPEHARKSLSDALAKAKAEALENDE